jgi:hypothetical protein
MKKYSNAVDELNDLYDLARKQGRAHTKKEFAELLGIHPANMSQFMSGYTTVTWQMMKRIKDAAAVAGITTVQEGDDNTAAAIVESGDVLGGHAQKNLPSQDPRWFDLVAEKDRQIDRLLGIIENMQK